MFVIRLRSILVGLLMKPNKSYSANGIYYNLSYCISQLLFEGHSVQFYAITVVTSGSISLVA